MQKFFPPWALYTPPFELNPCGKKVFSGFFRNFRKNGFPNALYECDDCFLTFKGEKNEKTL